jgi:hypothetical protein
MGSSQIELLGAGFMPRGGRIDWPDLIVWGLPVAEKPNARMIARRGGLPEANERG